MTFVGTQEGEIHTHGLRRQNRLNFYRPSPARDPWTCPPRWLLRLRLTAAAPHLNTGTRERQNLQANK